MSSQQERIVADELQVRLNALHEPHEAMEFHRLVHSTGGGWVEVQADYLTFILDKLGARKP